MISRDRGPSFGSYSICSALFGVVLFCLGCTEKDHAAELVLQDGATVIARSRSGGDILIRAKGELGRTYEWSGCSLRAHMRRRDSRWLGSLGIYDPAGSFGVLSEIFPRWFKCNGVSRTVVEEGQLHFPTKEKAENWLARYSKTSPTVWSDDGLVVQWGFDLPREQINVDVWQLCIAGSRPAGLLPNDSGATLVLQIDGRPGSTRFGCSAVEPRVPTDTEIAWNDFWRTQSR